MISRWLVGGCASAAAVLCAGAASAAPGAWLGISPASRVEQVDYRHRHHRGWRPAPGGQAYYRVNRYGYGHYVHGPNGRSGGYPAGSAGARELQINRELECRYSPERC